MLPTIRYRPPTTRREATLGFDLDRWFDGMLENMPATRFSPGAADLSETEDAYELALDVPGFADDEVEVTVDRGILTVTAERRAQEEDEGRTYHVRERRYERFARSFNLPASVRADEVDANLEDGVLTVHLPKTPEAKPRRIPVGINKN
ncbi:MAG: Hsp20/alpha crystallin family protein [Gemmatimonadota bacterium]|nr:Hsp20/alpha crystallin family protein [Gemmatimonadota bacterium]